jgi:hypothetical protein
MMAVIPDEVVLFLQELCSSIITEKNKNNLPVCMMLNIE